MPLKKAKNKMIELAVKQNLLLWELSESFLEMQKKMKDSLDIKHTKENSKGED